MVDAPILLLIFNRPEHTRKVFERIREAKPKQLFIAADGPRKIHPDDFNKCQQVRKFVLDSIDWPCDVKTLFREQNLGCGEAPAGAITWFFDHVESGIILEDDCLPHSTFFNFCGTLLEYYKNDDRIMHISGTNLQNGRAVTGDSYYFSQYPHSWGWATWRRAWSKFSFKVTDEPKEIENHLTGMLTLTQERRQWLKTFIQAFHSHRSDIWDFQWCYAVWKNKGISILPSKALIENLGFGAEATHTSIPIKQYRLNKVSAIDKVTHPVTVSINREADYYTYKKYFKNQTSLPNHFRNMAYKIVPKPMYTFLRNIYRGIRI